MKTWNVMAIVDQMDCPFAHRIWCHHESRCKESQPYCLKNNCPIKKEEQDMKDVNDALKTGK